MRRTVGGGQGTPIGRAPDESGTEPTPLSSGGPLSHPRRPCGVWFTLGARALVVVAATGLALDLAVGGWPRTPAAGLLLAPLAVSATVVAARFSRPAEDRTRPGTPGLAHRRRVQLRSPDELELPGRDLAGSRLRIVAAADESRRRIERDLHDGAQQHLVVLALKAGLVSGLIDTDPRQAKALADELRVEAQVALAELRELARGIYPALLRERGLVDAVRAAALRVPLPTVVECDGLRRFDRRLEAAVYFCCVEAMQNAGRHAGREASVCVRLDDDAIRLRFEVADDGIGFATRSVPPGQGLVNMHDRLRALGGTLEIDTAPRRGTVVRGLVPLC